LCSPEGLEVRDGKLAWVLGLHATSDLSLDAIHEFKALAQAQLEQAAKPAGGSVRLVAIEKHNRYSVSEIVPLPV
jgi:hypothetical protein